MSASTAAQTATTTEPSAAAIFAHFIEVLVIFKTVFVDVGDVHCWLQRQELKGI